jgi:hypothetical protein
MFSDADLVGAWLLCSTVAHQRAEIDDGARSSWNVRAVIHPPVVKERTPCGAVLDMKASTTDHNDRNCTANIHTTRCRRRRGPVLPGSRDKSIDDIEPKPILKQRMVLTVAADELSVKRVDRPPYTILAP